MNDTALVDIEVVHFRTFQVVIPEDTFSYSRLGLQPGQDLPPVPHGTDRVEFAHWVTPIIEDYFAEEAGRLGYRLAGPIKVRWDDAYRLYRATGPVEDRRPEVKQVTQAQDKAVLSLREAADQLNEQLGERVRSQLADAHLAHLVLAAVSVLAAIGAVVA